MGEKISFETFLCSPITKPAFSDTWFKYKGQTYITTKSMLNEVYRLTFNGQFTELELLIELSDDIQKI
jgi:hypothetical protein